MKDRIQNLLQALNSGIYEKENEIAMSLLAAVAGESIILLGPPGVAKSMVARRLKDAFGGERSFEYLMSHFSTPDEIFGPVSISKLKSSDDYERVTDGYLPTADVVFLDEIWKAGPAIQNTLLTVINEKVFRNGNKIVHIPLKLLVAASNELPAQGEGLEALWDRFIIRLETKPISLDTDFDRMLLQEEGEDVNVPKGLQITNEEYASWSKALPAIGIGNDVLDAIHQIRRSLVAVPIDGTDERRTVYVSDRRWKNIARLLRASAFLQDRETVGIEDLLPVYNCVWMEPEERDSIRAIVARCIFSSFISRLEDMKRSLTEDIKTARAERAANRISNRQMERDADKKVYKQFYYKVEDYHDLTCYIFSRDYQNLPAFGHGDLGRTDGVLYRDAKHPKVYILRSYDGSKATPLGSTLVTLGRDDENVYIDDVMFHIETVDTPKAHTFNFDDSDSGRDYGKEIDALADELEGIVKRINDNLFVAKDDKIYLSGYLSDFYKQLAFTRQDIGKLYDL